MPNPHCMGDGWGTLSYKDSDAAPQVRLRVSVSSLSLSSLIFEQIVPRSSAESLSHCSEVSRDQTEDGIEHNIILNSILLNESTMFPA